MASKITKRAEKKRALQDALPPTQFPKIINPHPFDPSTVVGDKTCLVCGQVYSHKLHIKPHAFNVNLSSKLQKCMCGLSALNPIHMKEYNASRHGN